MTAPRRPLGTGPRTDSLTESVAPSRPTLVERIAVERRDGQQPEVELGTGSATSRRALGTGAEGR
ncbi:hypothetical protein [Streptomyces sp. TR06-5]|uniref:hypothetical protein n=1 Tax=Streptomyces sp. TR06-5 TaxID=3385976 RepID=UPI0039A22B92